MNTIMHRRANSFKCCVIEIIYPALRSIVGSTNGMSICFFRNLTWVVLLRLFYEEDIITLNRCQNYKIVPWMRLHCYGCNGSCYVNRCCICRHVSCIRLMIRQLMDMTGDLHLCQVIRGLLSNRRFFVKLNYKKSRWMSQKNGLQRGCV